MAEDRAHDPKRTVGSHEKMMGHQNLTNGRYGGGTSNPKNWGNEDDHKPAASLKGGPDIDMPDYADHYEEKHT